MDEEFKKQLADRFEGFELVELLDISAEIVIDRLEEVIEENVEYLKEVLNGRG